MLPYRFEYSKTGLQLTERFEGCRLTAYADVTGVPTVGYGHTGKAITIRDGYVLPAVVVGDVWTQQMCDDALQSDIAWASNAVNTMLTFPINQQEFDALVDWVFTIGVPRFAKSSAIDLLNSGNLAAAAAVLCLYDKAGGKVIAGLLRRRQAEMAEFVAGEREGIA